MGREVRRGGGLERGGERSEKRWGKGKKEDNNTETQQYIEYNTIQCNTISYNTI